MIVFFHWSACYPPTQWHTTDHHHGQQSSEQRIKKNIQIHTLKYANAVKKKYNIKARLNKFKTADDGNASLSSSTSHSQTVQIPSVLNFPSPLLQIQHIIVLNFQTVYIFLANMFLNLHVLSNDSNLCTNYLGSFFFKLTKKRFSKSHYHLKIKERTIQRDKSTRQKLSFIYYFIYKKCYWLFLFKFILIQC